jgi:hypothetical protein
LKLVVDTGVLVGAVMHAVMRDGKAQAAKSANAANAANAAKVLTQASPSTWAWPLQPKEQKTVVAS